MSYFPIRRLLVRFREPSGRDRLGNEACTFSDPQAVDGCLFAWGEPAEAGESRPEGVRVAATAHFPRGWGLGIKGALVSPDNGGEWLRVIGDPRPYGTSEVRGPWGMRVTLERTDG